MQNVTRDYLVTSCVCGALSQCEEIRAVPSNASNSGSKLLG